MYSCKDYNCFVSFFQELVSSPKSALKAKIKYHGILEESASAKTKRKRGRGTEEVLRNLLINCGVLDNLEIIRSYSYMVSNSVSYIAIHVAAYPL